VGAGVGASAQTGTDIGGQIGQQDAAAGVGVGVNAPTGAGVGANANIGTNAGVGTNTGTGAGANVGANASSDVGVRATASNDRKAQWRFRQHNGEWWYWTPQNTWMYHRDGNWQAFDQATYQYPRGWNNGRFNTGFRGNYGYYDGYNRPYVNRGYGYRNYNNNYVPGYRYGTGYRGYGNNYYGNGGFYGGGYVDPGFRAGANVGSAIGGAIGGGEGAGIGAAIGGAIGSGR
jgi:hypothetical protein